MRSDWAPTPATGISPFVTEYRWGVAALGIEKFGPQMWDPFRDWVSHNHPKDFEVMYVSGGTNLQLTEKSIRLWGQRTREYVKEVKRST